MAWERIVFMQGEEASDVLGMLDTEGIDSVLDYLAQWDNGDGGDIHAEPASGSSDDVYEEDGYRLTWNNGLGYIGLEREVSKQVAEESYFRVDR